MPRGDKAWTQLSSCDLLVPGSPQRRMLMSERMPGVASLVPPNSMQRRPFFTSLRPLCEREGKNPPDRWRQGGGQFFVERGVGGKFLEIGDFLGVERFRRVFADDFPRRRVRNMAEMENVDIGAENVLNCALFPVDANGHRAENTRHIHFIPRFHAVEQVVVRIQRHRLGRFALRNEVGDLLHLDQLLVCEETAIVVHLHRIGHVAVGTAIWLRDAMAVTIHLQREVTGRAAEGRDAEVGEKVAHARDHALQTHETFDVVRAQAAHGTLLVQVEHAQVELLRLQRLALRQVLDDLVQDLLEDVDHHSGSLHDFAVESVRFRKRSDIRQVQVENVLSLF